jgi:hypothetical protein
MHHDFRACKSDEDPLATSGEAFVRIINNGLKTLIDQDLSSNKR